MCGISVTVKIIRIAIFYECSMYLIICTCGSLCVLPPVVTLYQAVPDSAGLRS